MGIKKDGSSSKRDVRTKPFRVYYDEKLTDIDDIRKSIVQTVAYWSHKNINFDVYKETQGFVKWHCYKCRKEISIDITKYDDKSIFCEKHKPIRFDNKYKYDTILMRYVSSLFSHVRQTIINNSNTDLYGL